MDAILRAYDAVFYESADPRVKDWLFMRSPWPLIAVLTTYLALIKVILPAHMRHRRAYDLRNIIKWYNTVQIITNAVVSWGLITSGWTTTYHLGCMPTDYSTNPEPMRMLRFLWWTVVLKLMELCETIFFILRKKERQASFLHVYHHVSTLTLIWAATKYIGGGMASFPTIVNTMVHVVMYTYYLLSAEGSDAVKVYLAKYKKWITIMQMVQFTIILIYGSQVFLPSCSAPIGIVSLYFTTVIMVYYMFYDFYKQNYVKRKSSLNANGNGVNKSANRDGINKNVNGNGVNKNVNGNGVNKNVNGNAVNKNANGNKVNKAKLAR